MPEGQTIDYERPGSSTHLSAVGPSYHFTPLSFAENMAALVLLGLVIALAVRSQSRVERS